MASSIRMDKKTHTNNRVDNRSKKTQSKPQQHKARYVIGIDEVGRGPLAGPVTVCAFCVDTQYVHISDIIDHIYQDTGIRCFDSKSVSPQKRDLISCTLHQLSDKSPYIHFSIRSKSANTIDQKGIAVCIKSLVGEVLKQIRKSVRCDDADIHVLLDGGLVAPSQYVNQQTIIKGDVTEPVIGLASILAKVHRDRYMCDISRSYPLYKFDIHKGYGTLMHRQAIRNHGVAPIHRLTFLRNILGHQTSKTRFR